MNYVYAALAGAVGGGIVALCLVIRFAVKQRKYDPHKIDQCMNQKRK